jgi:hypothetical protein
MRKLCKWVEQQFNYRQQSDELKTPPSSKGFVLGMSISSQDVAQ